MQDLFGAEAELALLELSPLLFRELTFNENSNTLDLEQSKQANQH